MTVPSTPTSPLDSKQGSSFIRKVSTLSMSDNRLSFDPYSDITLKVGKTEERETHVAFEACSRSLARASPVFDRMLYGMFSESERSKTTTADGEWVVTLPNDKAAPMRLFLNIVHGNFSAVPDILSVDDLYELTVLTDYYDATPILSPWVDVWMSSIREVIHDANDLMPKMLWVSWELGHREAFIVTAQRMLMESKVPWSAELAEMAGIQVPPDIVERIEAIRLQTFQAWLQVFSQQIEDLIVVDERTRCCRHATWLGPHRCESMILGSMAFCLARAGLWPLPDSHDVRYSIHGLYHCLTNLIIHDIGQAEATGDSKITHAECNPRAFLYKQVEAIMKEIPNPLTDFHEEHFKAKASKLPRNQRPQKIMPEVLAKRRGDCR